MASDGGEAAEAAAVAEEEDEESFDVWYSAAEAEISTIETAHYASKRSNGRRRYSAAESDISAIETAHYASNRSKGRRRCSAAEAEISAIETAHYASKRSNGRRRLPDWGKTARSRWSPSPCTVNLQFRRQSMNFGGRIVYCRTACEVAQATRELLDKIIETRQNMDQISLGFDIEWKPCFQRGKTSKAAVMQLCMDSTNCYVMHIIHSGIPPILKYLLEDCSSVKVGVCIANDARIISRDYNVCVEPLEDLSGIANLKLGLAPKTWSLAGLTETITCKELAKPKKIRMGNWEVKELSRDQLHYAATDAFVCWYLHQVLKNFPEASSDNVKADKLNDASP